LLGHADFWQDFFGACSHGRSYRYFPKIVETRNGFMAYNRASWDDYQAKECNGDPENWNLLPENKSRPALCKINQN